MTIDPWNDRRTPSISGASPDAAPLASIAMISPRAPSSEIGPAAPLAAARAPLATGRVPLAAVAAAASRDGEAPPPPRAALALTAVSGPSRSDPGWAVHWQPSEASAAAITAAATAAPAAAAPAAAAARPAPTLSRGAGSRSPALTATWYTTRVTRARTAP